MDIEVINTKGEIILSGKYKSIKKALEKNISINFAEAYLPKVGLAGANLAKVYLAGADLSGADLSGADLSGSDLSGAYLTGSHLAGANLTGANLTGATMTGAYLSNANLSGVKGIKLPILSISGSKHLVYYNGITIKIGCNNHNVDYWIKNYGVIGRENDYTDEQMREYYNYINFIKQLQEANSL
jgi:hypothetical protein